MSIKLRIIVWGNVCIGKPHNGMALAVDNWYEHHPDPAVQGDNAIILWYFSVNTVLIMLHNYLL